MTHKRHRTGKPLSFKRNGAAKTKHPAKTGESLWNFLRAFDKFADRVKLTQDMRMC